MMDRESVITIIIGSLIILGISFSIGHHEHEQELELYRRAWEDGYQAGISLADTLHPDSQKEIDLLHHFNDY